MDTIVMANLGYLQLKSNPGRWFLNLREGRSAELYDIVSHEGSEGEQQQQLVQKGSSDPQGSGDIQVLIDSFKVIALFTSFIPSFR